MQARGVESTEGGAWTHAALIHWRLALERWDEVDPMFQDIPSGYIQLTPDRVLTVAWQEGKRGTWAYIRLHPGRWGVARRLGPKESIPNAEHVSCPNDSQHVPGWAQSSFRIGMRWLLRLHAHTPIVRWIDTPTAELVAACAPYQVSRATWTIFAAPPGHTRDYSLQLKGTETPQFLWSIQIRVERTRQHIFVEQNKKNTRTQLQERSVTQIPWTEVHQTPDASLISRLLAYAVENQDRVDRVYEAAKHPRHASQSPATLTPERRTKLYALEQRWYHQHPLPSHPL